MYAPQEEVTGISLGTYLVDLLDEFYYDNKYHERSLRI